MKTLNTIESQTSTISDKMQGIPGLHIIANLKTLNSEKLKDFKPFKAFASEVIKKYSLTSVGEVYHNFEGGGYTGVLCLTESHLSIHTWPEHHYITFDVFLSNYLKDNRKVTELIYREVIEFFNADVAFEQIIDR